MAKVDVTKELADKIKELRVINKVKAIDLADHIQKSSAFITKLESGDIKTIDYDELLKIFNFISKTDEDLEKFMDKLTLELDSNELKDQIWYMNFDTIERNIPVPSDLVNFINEKMSSLGLSVDELVDYVNKNKDLNKIINNYNIDISKYKCNLWHTYNYEDGYSTFIVMKLSTSKLTNILNKKIDISNYVTIQSIVYNLLRLERDLDNNLNEEENKQAKDDTVSILNSYKFYSSIEKNKLFKTAATNQEFESLLSEFDIKNQEVINELLSYLSYLSEWNVKYTNEKITLLNKNLEWDTSYILTISSLPFFELDSISKSLKSNLLNDIRNLINDYKNKPKAEKTFEAY